LSSQRHYEAPTTRPCQRLHSFFLENRLQIYEPHLLHLHQHRRWHCCAQPNLAVDPSALARVSAKVTLAEIESSAPTRADSAQASPDATLLPHPHPHPHLAAVPREKAAIGGQSKRRQPLCVTGSSVRAGVWLAIFGARPHPHPPSPSEAMRRSTAAVVVAAAAAPAGAVTVAATAAETAHATPTPTPTQMQMQIQMQSGGSPHLGAVYGSSASSASPA